MFVIVAVPLLYVQARWQKFVYPGTAVKLMMKKFLRRDYHATYGTFVGQLRCIARLGSLITSVPSELHKLIVSYAPGSRERAVIRLNNAPFCITICETCRGKAYLRRFVFNR